MNLATAVLLQHANDIYTELVNDPELKNHKTDLLIIGEKFATLNKRMNRTYKQRYSDNINELTDLTSQQIKEAFIISQQYLSGKIKYNYLKQAAKCIQLSMLLNYAQYLYFKTAKEHLFMNDIIELIASVQRFLLGFDCQLSPDEEIRDIEICNPIYKKMCDVIAENL